MATPDADPNLESFTHTAETYAGMLTFEASNEGNTLTGHVRITPPFSVADKLIDYHTPLELGTVEVVAATLGATALELGADSDPDQPTKVEHRTSLMKHFVRNFVNALDEIHHGTGAYDVNG